MNKYELEKQINYEVYQYLDGKYDFICATKDYAYAKGLAIMLAQRDKDNDSYYVTGINYPGDFVPGGGWYDEFHKNEEGKIVMSSLS